MFCSADSVLSLWAFSAEVNQEQDIDDITDFVSDDENADEIGRDELGDSIQSGTMATGSSGDEDSKTVTEVRQEDRAEGNANSGNKPPTAFLEAVAECLDNLSFTRGFSPSCIKLFQCHDILYACGTTKELLLLKQEIEARFVGTNN